jgi:transposase
LDKAEIGADPHKHSVTIEVVDGRERVLHKGRYGTDKDGYQQMLAAVRNLSRPVRPTGVKQLGSVARARR